MKPVKPTIGQRRLDVWISEELHYDIRTRFSVEEINQCATEALIDMLNQSAAGDAGDHLYAEAFDEAAERDYNG